MTVDCGSCAVHVFSAEARAHYDLEGLWAKGVELEKRNNPDEVLTIDTITTHGGRGNAAFRGVAAARADDEDVDDDDDVDDDNDVDDDDDDDDDDASEDRLDIDLEHSGGLEEYEDEYVEPPSYALGSLTELTQKKAGMKTRGGKKEKKEKARVAFGDASKRIELDD